MSCYSLNIFLFSETECVETALIILFSVVLCCDQIDSFYFGSQSLTRSNYKIS